jgi:hypothetical protein
MERVDTKRREELEKVRNEALKTSIGRRMKAAKAAIFR